MDFDERITASNMYLPSCTYYVSGADFSGLPHYLTQNQSTCPVTYPYQSTALPQVPSVRDVAFRDYGIDTSNKWHHSRGSLSHCYTDDVVHRDGWTSPAPRGGEILVKGSSSGGSGHPGSSNHTSGFYGSVGRNGVLPQAFDQFFDTAYGSSEGSATAHAADADRHVAKTSPTSAQAGSDSAESFSPKSSSGHSEEKQSRSSGESRPAPCAERSCTLLLKLLYAVFISAQGLWKACRFTLTKLCYKRQHHVCLGLKLAVKTSASGCRLPTNM